MNKEIIIEQTAYIASYLIWFTGLICLIVSCLWVLNYVVVNLMGSIMKTIKAYPLFIRFTFLYYRLKNKDK